MDDGSRGGRRRPAGMPPVVGGGERRRTRSVAASEAAQGRAPPGELVPFAHHSLRESQPRGLRFGGSAIQGDDRLVLDAMRTFRPQTLPEPALNRFSELFGEATQATKRHKSTFAKVESFTREDGATESHAFAVVDNTNGILTGRTVDTPSAEGLRPSLDDASHAIPLSAVINQYAVNKRGFVFSESLIANRGGARAFERRALAEAHGTSDDIGIATITRTPAGEARPNFVGRALLKRSRSLGAIDLLFATSHDNDDGEG